MPPSKHSIHSLCAHISSVLVLSFFFSFCFEALEMVFENNTYQPYQFYVNIFNGVNVCSFKITPRRICVFIFSLSFVYFGFGDYLNMWPLLADGLHLQNRQGRTNSSPEAACSSGEGLVPDFVPMRLILVPCFTPFLGPASSQGLDFHGNPDFHAVLTFGLIGSVFLQ